MKLITSKVFVDNKNKNLVVEYTNGTTGYFTFEIFDKEE